MTTLPLDVDSLLAELRTGIGVLRGSAGRHESWVTFT